MKTPFWIPLLPVGLILYNRKAQTRTFLSLTTHDLKSAWCMSFLHHSPFLIISCIIQSVISTMRINQSLLADTAWLQLRQFYKQNFFYIFLISPRQHMCCGYSLEAPHRGTSYEHSNIRFHENICSGYCLETRHRGTANEYPQHTPQPLYNTIFGVHSIKCVS